MDETREKGRPTFHYNPEERIQGLTSETAERVRESRGSKKRKRRFVNRTFWIILVDIVVITLVFLFMSPLIRKTMVGEQSFAGYTIRAEAFEFDGATLVSVAIEPGEGAEAAEAEIVLTPVPGGSTRKIGISVFPASGEIVRDRFPGGYSTITVLARIGDEEREWKIPVRDEGGE